MRYQGKLTHWNDDKGFGFVEPNGGGDRSFVHIKSFNQRSKRPAEGDSILYEQINQAQGKFKAINVSLVADHNVSSKSPHKSVTAGALFTIAFSLVLVTTALLNLLPIEVVYWYIAASIITYVFYAVDKSAARHGRRRTRESHLHILSLMGGWLGAYYAQKKLRHKSSKVAFKRVHWATVLINISVFIWLFTEPGQQFKQFIVG